MDLGRVVEGKWSPPSQPKPEAAAKDGHYVRPQTHFRDELVPSVGRYHLYISRACPWAHRTALVRELKGLDHAISMTVLDPVIENDGWAFDTEHDPDPIFGAKFLHEIYVKSDPDYSGPVTVPVMWDKEKRVIANNESREILRMLDRNWNDIAKDKRSYCPPDLEADVEAAITRMYKPLNNGVYRSGFATTQAAYELAVKEVFDTINALDRVLETQRYVCGDRLTEADITLFPTLIRFDAVYHGHFKCNLRRIVDYEHLSGYLRELHQMPAVRRTVNIDHIKRHYYMSHRALNPTRIVPAGPLLDLDKPHGRERLKASTSAA
jgi:putative glutathione S-transferase